MWENFAPAMLINYVRDFSGVRIETFFETTTAINKFVGERVIDLGFLRMEGEIGPGIDVERLAPGKSVSVVREDHPLAALDEITVKDLRKHSAHSDRPAAIPSSIRVWLPNEKVHT